jgi:nitrous oxidase accessory protein
MRRGSGAVHTRVRMALAALVIWPLTATIDAQPATRTIVVSPNGAVRSITDGIARSRDGDRIVIEPGTYREPTIVVDRRVTIEGTGFPTLDGEGQREIMHITANGVTVRGLRFAHVGPSHVEDRAAIRVSDATGCAIENNRLDDAFFGIYLSRVTDCRVVKNVIRGTPRTEESSGNGIHLWSSSNVLVAENTISGHRDGLYFEFTRSTEARGNVSARNVRYGLHFMYSDSCRYLDNTFQRNGAGVAVMYTKTVAMVGNRFEDNRGSAAYGLLLKEIADPVLERNVFRGNTVGLFADGAARIVATGNRFENNGWAVKLMASTEDGRFAENEFVGNTFDVSSNSRSTSTRFDGNYWSAYEGYDLDRDGVGDVPHRPVRLFSILVEANEPTLILLRSLFVRLLDTAERVLPSLTPETLADARPAMRPLTPEP